MPISPRGSVAVLFLLLATAALAGEADLRKLDETGSPNPQLHLQPDAGREGAIPAFLGPVRPTDVVNGITVTDVVVAAGLNVGGADYGNEPSIAVNPLNPMQIAVTCFAGSSWASGGNSYVFTSTDGGTTWVRTQTIPPPTGVSTNINCPCDQVVDYGRDGILYATFLHLNTGGSVQSVYSAQSTNPTSAAAWSYRTNAGVAKKTNPVAYSDVDQPWLTTGPMAGAASTQQVAVAYDNFNASFVNEEVRNAGAGGTNPPDFVRDAAMNKDGQVYGDGMNPGNRTAIGPDGKVWNIHQRLVSALTGGIKQLTYLVNVSSDNGSTWITNGDHAASGAKTVAASVYSFQGNGSKIGGVNALLGGVDAITVDPSTGVAWLVYGDRASTVSADRLWLVSATHSGGAITLGTPRQISNGPGSAYLPAVAVLSNGEIGVLFVDWDGTSFRWILNQTTDGGASIAKTTTLATFTSPFSNNGASNQRILGDYVTMRASGCTFAGVFPARGTTGNTTTSIDPYFLSAPSFSACSPATLTQIAPPTACVGGSGFTLALTGTGFANGAGARAAGAGRATTFVGPTRLDAQIPAADLVSAGNVAIDVLGASPGGILTGSLALEVKGPTVSPGNSLRIAKSGASLADLSWSSCTNADSYRVNRCDPGSGPCVPIGWYTPVATSQTDPVLADGNTYWYSIAAVNPCGVVP